MPEYREVLAGLRDHSSPPSIEFLRTAAARRRHRRRAAAGGVGAVAVLISGAAALMAVSGGTQTELHAASSVEERYASRGREVRLLPSDELPLGVEVLVQPGTEPKVLGTVEGTELVVVKGLVNSSEPCVLVTGVRGHLLTSCRRSSEGPSWLDPTGTRSVGWFGVPHRTELVVLEVAGHRVWQRPTEDVVVLPLSLVPGATVSLTAYDESGSALALFEDVLIEEEDETETETETEMHPVDPGDGNRQLQPETVVAQGEVEGMPWELVAYPSDSGLCVDLRFWRGAGGGCGHDIGPHRAVNLGISSTQGGFRFAHGVTRTDVAAVRLEFGNGDILDLSTSKLVSFDVNFVATPLPADAVINAVVALDGQGRVLQELSGLELQ